MDIIKIKASDHPRISKSRFRCLSDLLFRLTDMLQEKIIGH